MTDTSTKFDPHQIAQEAVAEGRDPLTTVVFTALGAASACWSDLRTAGTFESDDAKEIGDALVAWLRTDEMAQAAAETSGCPATSQWGSATKGHKHRCAIPVDEHTVKLGLRQHGCQCGAAWKTREAG